MVKMLSNRRIMLSRMDCSLNPALYNFVERYRIDKSIIPMPKAETAVYDGNNSIDIKAMILPI